MTLTHPASHNQPEIKADTPPVGDEPVVVLDRDEAAVRALDASTAHLRALQQPDGYWKGELETNVTMDAEDLLLRHFLGLLDNEAGRAMVPEAARWIRSQQRPDGAWPTFFGGPGELSCTVEAYVALRLAGDDEGSEHLQRAATWIRQHGGLQSTRVFTRFWLAMVGCWDWEELPVVPPELIYLPSWGPLSIWSFGCWARQTIVALSVIMSHRPSRPLPFDIEHLRTPEAPRQRQPDLVGRLFVALDRRLHQLEARPAGRLRRSVRRGALRAAERWIIARQEADGCWGGIQPPMVYSTIALYLQGYPLDHPVLAAALRGLDAFTLHDERGRRVEACQSPVWDTALAVIALVDAGAPADDPAVARARQWLLDQEIRVKGDWAVRRPEVAPGGWAFEFQNVNYPDTDDTAEVVLALRRAGIGPGDPGDDACRRGVNWTVGLQSRDGGWGAFDADNISRLPNRLPFFDFGRVTDPPSADVTAHIVEMLAGEPDADPEALRRGIAWLSSHEEPDGSWWGRWGVNYVYAAGAVVPALIAAGIGPSDRRITTAVRWVIEHQNDDGGWGEDLRSYVEPGWVGTGVSTASQTAWALMALLAAGQRDHPATARGVDWLCANQTPDGTWDEPWFTGTGFPWDFSLNYHLYRLVWPVTALGRYVRGSGPRP